MVTGWPCLALVEIALLLSVYPLLGIGSAEMRAYDGVSPACSVLAAVWVCGGAFWYWSMPSVVNDFTVTYVASNSNTQPGVVSRGGHRA